MKYRSLTDDDISKFGEDLKSCYDSNHLIFDNQCPIHLNTKESIQRYVLEYVLADDSCVLGIFDNEEKYLYGIVIFDNIRMGNKCSAELHIVNDKSIFGKKLKGVYESILRDTIFNTLYAQIPSIAVHAIAMCKRLGFKKTGYIPSVLPYTNSEGEEKMYDVQIWTYGG